VKVHIVEGSYATAEFTLLADLPSYKEWAENEEDQLSVIFCLFNALM
jgi:hypothetical protein